MGKCSKNSNLQQKHVKYSNLRAFTAKIGKIRNREFAAKLGNLQQKSGKYNRNREFAAKIGNLQQKSGKYNNLHAFTAFTAFCRNLQVIEINQN